LTNNNTNWSAGPQLFLSGSDRYIVWQLCWLYQVTGPAYCCHWAVLLLSAVTAARCLAGWHTDSQRV